MGRPKGSKNKPAHEQQTEALMSTTKEDAPERQVVVPTEQAKEIIQQHQEKKAEVIQQKFTKRQLEEIEDSRLVTGTFVYRAKPGGRYKTTLRKYKNDPNSTHAAGFIPVDMIDGRTYTVPQWVADWLNGEKEHSCVDFKHSAGNINLETEARGEPERVPVFRFIIQRFAA